jgi:hypothetical protein
MTTIKVLASLSRYIQGSGALGRLGGHFGKNGILTADALGKKFKPEA